MITGDDLFWKTFKETYGALSACEAIAIMNLAAMVPPGSALELGTHKGKSAMAAIIGLPGSQLDIVEPEFIDEKWKLTTCARIVSVKSLSSVFPHAGYSTDVIPNFVRLAWVFVDSGSHQDGLPMQEVKMLEDRVVPDGIIAFHDFNSQFIEVREAYDYLLSTGKYEEVSIDWPGIIAYAKAHDLEKDNNSWHHNELEFPCFVGALKRK